MYPSLVSLPTPSGKRDRDESDHPDALKKIARGETPTVHSGVVRGVGDGEEFDGSNYNWLVDDGDLKVFLNGKELEDSNFYWFVEDSSSKEKYFFDNRIEHNPYRGQGSQYRLLLSSADKTTQFSFIRDTEKNTTDRALVGPRFEIGQRVDFIPKHPNELLCTANGDVLISHVGKYPHDFPLEIPGGLKSLAVDLVLSKSGQVPRE